MEKKKRSYYNPEHQQRYKKAHVKQIAFTLNDRTDADILEHLERIPNKQGYIKQLIRDDMAKS